MIQQNLELVLEKIDKANRAAGIRAEEIRLVAVTKTVPAGIISEGAGSGFIKEIGESKVQECLDKFSAVNSTTPGLKWHMIGHLQRNKVNRAVEVFDLIQSVDSLRLLGAINKRAAELGKVQACLVEIKVSDEPDKYGLPPEDLQTFLESSRALANIRLDGIMCIAPYSDDASKARPYFARARELFNKFFTGANAAGGTVKPILSMGMSHDFEEAIKEGSNMVRIGAAIFGERA